MDYSQTKPLQNCPFHRRFSLKQKYVASVVHAKVLGTEPCPLRILHDGNALATRIWREQVFLMRPEDQVRIARRNLEERAGWTEDLKALRQRHRTVTDSKFYGQYDRHAPQNQSEGLRT